MRDTKVLDAVVLAGGSSRRFHGDKLFFKVKGKPLILHVIDKLYRSKNIDEVHVVSSPDKVDLLRSLGMRNIIEDNLLIGPMGAVLIALRIIGDAFIVAGDMPLVNPGFIDYIVETYYGMREKYYAFIPGWRNGYLEPLHGVYRKSLVRVLEERVREKSFSLQKTLRGLGGKIYVIILDDLPLEYRLSVYNVNTIEDLRRIEPYLRDIK